MMTRLQAILGKIAEEANEVGQRALKAQRFGVDEIQSGQSDDNLTRLMDEVIDLMSAMVFLGEELGDERMDKSAMKFEDSEEKELEKRRARFEKYYEYSIEKGMIEKNV